MQRSVEVEATLEDIRSAALPEQIRALVDEASADAARFRPAPDAWSIVEILRHLGDIEEHRHLRFDRMLAEENPVLTRPPLGPGDRDSEDPKILFARWQRLRARALERLSAMSEHEWRRVGTQTPNPTGARKDYSPTSVLDQAGRINLHAADHLDQMRANLAAFNG